MNIEHVTKALATMRDFDLPSTALVAAWIWPLPLNVSTTQDYDLRERRTGVLLCQLEAMGLVKSHPPPSTSVNGWNLWSLTSLGSAIERAQAAHG